MTRRYFVGEYTVDHPISHRERSLFSDRDEDSVCWGSGPQYTSRSYLQDLVILKDYAGLTSGEVYAQFDKDFPPEPFDVRAWPRKDFDGWLSPDGIFYKCDWMAHTSTAIDLVASFFPDEMESDNYHSGRDAEDIIRNKGYARIAHGGISITRGIWATEVQKQWLKELIELNPNFPGYTDPIKMFLEMQEEHMQDE